MKKILLLAFLLSMVAFAKKDTLTKGVCKIKNYGILNIPSPDYSSIINYKGQILITDKTIFDYEKECYNDSTLVQVNVNPDKNISHNGITTCVYYPPIWENKWSHKDSSFKGFILWLHKKK